MYDCLGVYQLEVKLADQMGSGCGTFVSSSPLEGV